MNLIPVYGYANARVKARKSKLLSKDKVKQISSLNSLTEIIAILEETAYKPFFVEASTKYTGVELVNKALNASLVEDLRKVFHIWPNDKQSLELRKLLIEEWTIQNAKIAIASMATGVKLQDEDLIAISDHQKDLVQKLLDSDSMEKTLNALTDTRFGISILIRDLKKKNPEDFRVYFKAFDDYYLKRLFETAKTQPDHYAASILWSKAKATLAITILRLKSMGFKPSEIEDAITLPKGHLSALKGIVGEEDFEKCVEKAFKTFHVKKETIDEYDKNKSLAYLEAAIEKTSIERTLKTAKVAVFSPAVIMGYIYAKQAEIATIKAICYSTHAGITAEVRKFVNI